MLTELPPGGPPEDPPEDPPLLEGPDVLFDELVDDEFVAEGAAEELEERL